MGKDKLIKDYSAAELQAVDIGEGHHMPLLREVIEVTKSKIFVSAEMKGECPTTLPAKILSVIAEMEGWEDVGVSSFEFNLLEKVK